MTKEETQQILKVLKINYPNSWSKLTNDETFMFLDLWAEAFKHDEANVVISAVKAIIYSDRSDFAPSIGKVKHMIYKLTQPQFPAPSEAWEMLNGAIDRSLFGNAQAEFEALPQPIRDVVGKAEVLKRFTIKRDGTFNTTYKSAFTKDYIAKVEEIENRFCMPLEAQNMLESQNVGCIEWK